MSTSNVQNAVSIVKAYYIAIAKNQIFFQDCISTFRKDNADVYFVKIDPPTDTLDNSALTRAIGSTFYDNGVKLRVCDANVCGSYLPCFSHCYYHLEKCGDKMTIHGFCGIKTRSDRKDVYFKEVKDEEQ